MRGYSGIDRSLSACLHFVRNDEVDESLAQHVQGMKDLKITCTYIDYIAMRGSNVGVANYIGRVLELENAPYYPVEHWVAFLDDLISLSDEIQGLVIVIDNAHQFFAEARNEAFDLIESFLIQFHHWLEKRKPCHLCFQMEPNALIRRVFLGELASEPSPGHDLL